MPSDRRERGTHPRISARSLRSTRSSILWFLRDGFIATDDAARSAN
jgi:hypothetical protein